MLSTAKPSRTCAAATRRDDITRRAEAGSSAIDYGCSGRCGDRSEVQSSRPYIKAVTASQPLFRLRRLPKPSREIDPIFPSRQYANILSNPGASSQAPFVMVRSVPSRSPSANQKPAYASVHPARFSPCRLLIASAPLEGRADPPVGGYARSIKSHDLDCGRRCLTEDLVLDLRPCEAPFASRSIRRSCLSSCLYGSDRVERRVGAIVPAKDDL